MPLPEHVEANMTNSSGGRERRASVSVAPSAEGFQDPLQERILKGDFIF
jgi:hypothetical protein